MPSLVTLQKGIKTQKSTLFVQLQNLKSAISVEM
nr:MAG TPA: hypothetical protein [Caudoviricetes sp.]